MNKKMNQKKQNRMAVRQAAAKAVLRDEQNRRIQFAATNPEGEDEESPHHPPRAG